MLHVLEVLFWLLLLFSLLLQRGNLCTHADRARPCTGMNLGGGRPGTWHRQGETFRPNVPALAPAWIDNKKESRICWELCQKRKRKKNKGRLGLNYPLIKGKQCPGRATWRRHHKRWLLGMGVGQAKYWKTLVFETTKQKQHIRGSKRSDWTTSGCSTTTTKQFSRSISRGALFHAAFFIHPDILNVLVLFVLFWEARGFSTPLLGPLLLFFFCLKP